MPSARDNERKLIEKTSAEFARKELSQIVETSGTEYFSPAYNTVIQKAWDLDFFHILLPEAEGEKGSNPSSLCTVLENLSMEDGSLGAIMLTTITAYEILLACGQASRLKLFTDHAYDAKTSLLGFPLFASAEENEVTVTAVDTDKGFVLSGDLNYLVLAGLSDHAVIPAKINGTPGLVFFLIDLTHAGVTISEPVCGLGLLACPVADVGFDRTPAIPCCQPEAGESILNQIHAKLSIALAAMELGMMKGSFRDALAYTHNRQQGGRKIIHWSEVKKILSNMAINIQLAEMLVLQGCDAMASNQPTWQAAAIAASIRIAEMADEVTSDGIRVMGGVGYMKDFHQERRFREARHLMSVFGMHQLKKLAFLENHVSKNAAYYPQEL